MIKCKRRFKYPDKQISGSSAIKQMTEKINSQKLKKITNKTTDHKPQFNLQFASLINSKNFDALFGIPLAMLVTIHHETRHNNEINRRLGERTITFW